MNIAVYELNNKENKKKKLRSQHIFRKFKHVKNIDLSRPYNKSEICHYKYSLSKHTHFHIGFDSEWQRIDENSNKILSYQFWIESLNRGLLVLVSDVRWPLAEVVSSLYEFIKECSCRRIEKIILVCHFSRAEMFSLDLKKSVEKFKNLTPIHKSLVSSYFEEIDFYDKNRNKKVVEVMVRDTNLITPYPLKKLGEYIGIAKIENEGFIDSMETLLHEDLEKYTAYAIVDSLIAVQFMIAFDSLAYEKFAIKKPLITASQLSETLFREMISDPKAFLGYREKRHISKGKKGIHRSKKLLLPEEIRRGEEAYYGGRNEAFKFGFYQDAVSYDYDLKNAYPSALLFLRDINWDNYQRIRCVDDLDFDDVGYVTLDFKFKEDIFYPLFPIKTEYGLIFVKEGRTRITIPELLVAVKHHMLEEYEIIEGIVFDKKEGSVLPDFISGLIRERSQCQKGSLEDLLYKTAANSFYGKTAQGINPKKSLDIAASFAHNAAVREDVKKGRIYPPMIAAYMTGCVRALVGEYLFYLHQKGTEVYSVTTDGFLIGRKLEDDELKGVGYLSRELSKKRNLWVGDDHVLALKNVGKGTLVWRTRGYLMERNLPDAGKDKRLLARGGIQTKGMKKDKAIDYLIDRFLTAKPGDTYLQKSLSNIRDYIEDGITDLVEKSQEVSCNMDYDFKRQPLPYQDCCIERTNETYHKAAFDTKAWSTVEEFLAVKRGYENFKKHEAKNNKLQTVEDIKQFETYVQGSLLSDTYCTSVEKLIRKKFAMALLLLGFTRPEICRSVAIERWSVRDIEESKTFKNIKDGKKVIKKLDFADCLKYDELIRGYLNKLDDVSAQKVVGMMTQCSDLYIRRGKDDENAQRERIKIPSLM